MRISSSRIRNRESRGEAIQDLCQMIMDHHFACISITYSSMDSGFRTYHCYSTLFRCGAKAPNKETQRNLPLIRDREIAVFVGLTSS
jgi:hypothetical protein